MIDCYRECLPEFGAGLLERRHLVAVDIGRIEKSRPVLCILRFVLVVSRAGIPSFGLDADVLLNTFSRRSEAVAEAVDSRLIHIAAHVETEPHTFTLVAYDGHQHTLRCIVSDEQGVRDESTERTLESCRESGHDDIECGDGLRRSEEHTSELQSLMRISYAVFCLKKKKKQTKIG